MGWSIKEKEKKEGYEKSIRNLSYIEKCFVRKHHACGKVLGASKSCFIASPDEPELGTLLALIIEKLAKVGVEAVIAINERAYGQDIFCTKICGKIIESKFCIVILDDSVRKKVNVPNPNVYYEYGLMTALNKQIIPLQKEELKLAFNIQSHDTIKYSNTNIATELDAAIKEGLRIIDTEFPQILLDEKSILRKLELNGFRPVSERWFLKNAIHDTNFLGYVKGVEENKHAYLFIAKVDNKEETWSVLDDLEIVALRVEKKSKERLKEFENELKKLSDAEKKGTKPSTIALADLQEERAVIKATEKLHIAFFVSPEIDATELIQKSHKILSAYKRYELVYNKDNEIAIGKLVINLAKDMPE